MKQLRRVLISIAGFLAVASHLAGQASISGQVQLGKAKTGGAATPRYAGKSSTVVGPPPPPVAIVYLEGYIPSGGEASATNVPAKMEQKNLQFVPGIMAVQKGTMVLFPNLDDEFHVVYSASKPRSFNIGRHLKKDKPPEINFDKAGVVELSCEIHEHMQGTILVLDTPYFTQTDTNGNYRLEKLPTGKFTLKAWLNLKTVRSQPVDLKDGEALKIDFPGK